MHEVVWHVEIRHSSRLVLLCGTTYLGILNLQTFSIVVVVVVIFVINWTGIGELRES